MWQTDAERRKDVVNLLVGVGLMLVLLVLLLFVERSADGTYDTGAIVLMALDIFVIVLMFASLFIKQYSRRRRMLARKDVVSVTQPAADEYALALPITIELRMDRVRYILSQALFFGLFWTIITLLTGSLGSLTFVHFLVTLFLAFIVGGLIGLVNFYLVGRYREQTITVDDWGMTVLGNRKNMHVDWQAAHFFGVRRDKKSATTGLYELSDATTTVTWRWFPPVFVNPLNSLRLTIPYDEYTRQMAALLSVVEGRTHLPLHDLRGYTEQTIEGLDQEQE